MALFKKDGQGDIPWLSAQMVLEFESPEKAENVLRSVDVDNHSFISCRRDGRKIICETRSDSPGTLLHTLDDLISCIITAEDVYRSI